MHILTTVRGTLHDPVQKKSRPASVTCDARARELRVAADGREWTIPMARLDGSGGGVSGSALHLAWEEPDGRWSVTIDGRDVPMLSSALEEVAPPGLRAVVRYVQRDRRSVRPPRIAWGTIFLSLVLVALIAVVGAYLFRDRAVSAVLDRVPPSVDAQIAQNATLALSSSGRLVDHGAAASAVQTIGARLAASLPDTSMRFRFVVARDTALNAYAVPGGLIVVDAGLLAAADSANEVAGVLAHEMAHALHRDGMRALLAKLGPTAIVHALTGKASDVSNRLAQSGADLATLRMSRGQESAADLGALDILQAAHVAPTGFIVFFERLSRTASHQTPAVRATHPTSADRGAMLRAEVRKRGEWEVRPLAVNWKAAQRDAKAIETAPQAH